MVWVPKKFRTTYGGYSTSAWKEYYNEELNDPQTGALNNSNAAALEYRDSLEEGAKASARDQFDAVQAAKIEKQRKKLERKTGKKVPQVSFDRQPTLRPAVQERGSDSGWGKTAQPAPVAQDGGGWGSTAQPTPAPKEEGWGK